MDPGKMRNRKLNRSTAIRSAIGLFLVVCSAAVGCGNSQPAVKLVPVTGTVKLDGKPLAGAVLIFNPMPNTHGTGATAITDAEGTFTLTHASEKPGIEAGDYGITFSKVTQPDGSPIPAGKTRAGVTTVEQIPKPYTKFDPERVIARVTVTNDAKTFDFELKSNIQEQRFGGQPRS
jgi:hypothetical protein